MKIKKILFVGCGELAACTINELQSPYEIYGMRRNIKNLPAPQSIIKNNIIGLEADLNDPISLEILKKHSFDDVIVSLTPDAMTEAAYHKNYYLALQNLLSVLAENPPKHLFWISSTRVYGQTHTGLIDEQIPPIPSDFRGQILLESEKLLHNLPYLSTILRPTGIYSPHKNRLIKMASSMALRMEKSEDQTPSNRIHAQDIGRFIAHLIDNVAINSRKSLYLVTDDYAAPFCNVIEYIQTLLAARGENLIDCDAKNQAHINPININLTNTNQNPININPAKKFSNALAKSTGWTLKYPSYQEGFNSIIREHSVL